MSRKPPFTVKRAYGAGCVRISAALKVSDYRGRLEAITMQADAEIPAADARALAAELVAEANRVDAVAAEKAAAEARREKWREREIAAGRMKVMSAEEFVRR